MRLQLNSTVNYALKNSKAQPVARADIAVPSPYNTYLHAGLPPGPIDSPGEDAINAVLAPAAGNWLYWVTVDPKTGETKFTNSYAEFLQFKAELQGERRMRAAVLGSPIAHSLSPVLHRAAYAHLGLALDATTPSSATRRGCRLRRAALRSRTGPGLSLTMPLKAAVLPLLDSVDEVVAPGGGGEHRGAARRAPDGANTDVPGMVAALAERGIDPGRRVAGLGGGRDGAVGARRARPIGWRAATVYARRRSGPASCAADRGPTSGSRSCPGTRRRRPGARPGRLDGAGRGG